MGKDFPFNGNDIFSFVFSLKPLLQLEGDQYFLKNLISASGNPFLYFFSDTYLNKGSLLVYINPIFQLIFHSG